jgi:hypothetical protein
MPFCQREASTQCWHTKEGQDHAGSGYCVGWEKGHRNDPHRQTRDGSWRIGTHRRLRQQIGPAARLAKVLPIVLHSPSAPQPSQVYLRSSRVPAASREPRQPCDSCASGRTQLETTDGASGRPPCGRYRHYGPSPSRAGRSSGLMGDRNYSACPAREALPGCITRLSRSPAPHFR